MAEHITSRLPGCEIESGALEARRLAQCTEEADIIINGTSVGMWKQGKPLDESSLVPADQIMSRHLVCDVVYNPLVTPLLSAAKRRKAKVLTGLGMIIYQGAEAFRIWTGCELPVQLVRRRLKRALSEAQS